jgi:hypothetical protein
MPELIALSRTVPQAIRRQLRAEVGFGCPICGSPHLEYHHFDPPWSQRQHHNPIGMIALCARHHDAADSGAFTTKQLRDLKSAERTKVQSTFQWRRKHTVFVCGGNYAYCCQSMLNVSGIDILYFEKDSNGCDTLSLNIYDICMNRILEMRQNDWIARTNVDDIEAPPSARTLLFRSSIHRVDIQIEFKDRARLKNEEQTIALELGVPQDENVVFCIFNGSIPAPVPVKFTDSAIQFGGVTMSGNRIVNCGCGIRIG